ncbi:2-oxo acid dehydrogenase subunit E2 [Nocardia grenadensis]
MPEFRMPSLGADMTEGTLLHWLVHPGDTVHTGDVVAEVDTTKAAIEVECFDDGVVGDILVPEGRKVPVGTVLATIERVEQPTTEAAGPAPHGDTGQRARGSVPASTTAAGRELREGGAREAEKPAVPDFRATPLIRKLAAEAGIDLAAVRGSGPAGRIVRADIEAAVSAGAPVAPTERTEVAGVASGSTDGQGPVRAVRAPSPRASGYARRLAAALGTDLVSLSGSGPGGAIRARDVHTMPATPVPVPAATGSASGVVAAPTGPAGGGRDQAAIRRQIAAAMTRSKRTVPHYYLSDVIDVDIAVRWLREVNRSAPVPERIVPSALLLCATARAAARVGDLNGHWIDDEFRPSPRVHLGVVVSLRRGGILVPTVPDADELSPARMMTALRGVVGRARTARLRSSDTVEASISVTNIGEAGVRTIFGVIPAPQVAIVGFGTVTDRPCAVGGAVAVRPQVTITLSADHRASDGALGARFLTTVRDLLQHPEEL